MYTDDEATDQFLSDAPTPSLTRSGCRTRTDVDTRHILREDGNHFVVSWHERGISRGDSVVIRNTESCGFILVSIGNRFFVLLQWLSLVGRVQTPNCLLSRARKLSLQSSPCQHTELYNVFFILQASTNRKGPLRFNIPLRPFVKVYTSSLWANYLFLQAYDSLFLRGTASAESAISATSHLLHFSADCV